MVSLAGEKQIKCLWSWLCKSKRSLPVFQCKEWFWGKNELKFFDKVLNKMKFFSLYPLYFSLLQWQVEGGKTKWQYKR